MPEQTIEAARLRPYLPRLLIQWLAEDPGSMVRSLAGTVVFVDISGFTKLSEKLAKAGKVGAEEMADAINGCFTELLAIAYREDGSLLKFGGDALLLLFTEGGSEDHAVRGVRAAAGMRKRLREVGRIQTTRGQVTLRMSVGVHTGTYDFFLVGTSHRELLVTGPGATQVVAMEGAADAGEILLSPTTAALLPARCVGRLKGPGVLLRAAPPGEAAGLVSELPSIPDTLLDRCISLANREQLMAGSREPEHRQASVAFLHFDGTDEMRRAEGPEVLAEALQELVACVQEEVDAMEVSFLASDVDADGGKIILTAGVPRAIGDDQERMLLALRRIADSRFRLPIRIGVNHGPVFAGDIGPVYRRTYTVMGDTVNLAARVMSKAPPGEVYATSSVLDRSATRFEVSELEPFMVKGKARPVQAWAVGAPVGSRGRDEAQTQRLPLVGRDAEIRMLRELAEGARRGQGHLVEIVGEPGIGKTRLLEDLVEREVDLRTLQATAEAYTSSTPYATWRELLREMLDVGAEDPDEVVARRLHAALETSDADLIPWLPLLADAIDIEVPETPEVGEIAPEFRRTKLHEVVRRFVGGILNKPTLIKVEDGHLMDPASAELLASLVPGLSDLPWLIAVSRRDVPTGFVAPESTDVSRIDLSFLSAEAARSMILEATKLMAFLPRDEELVAQRSGGNPQFLLDLVRALASGSMLPDSVEAAATALIDSLSPDDRTLVRRASVFGISFHLRLLGDVLDPAMPAPDEETWSRLAEFFDAEGDGHLRFRRAVVRDAAYEGLAFRTRRALHAAVGSRLEAEADDPDDSAGILSLHFILAGDYERAFRYARVAAERADDVFANVEAARFYQRALDAARRLPDLASRDVADTYAALADAWSRGGEFGRAAVANAAARKLSKGDPIAEARLIANRSEIEGAVGRYPQARRWAAKGRALLDGDPSREALAVRADLDAWNAMCLFANGRFAPALEWAKRAIDEAEDAERMEALARAYAVLDNVGVTIGRYSGGEYWRRALAIHEQLGNLPGQSSMLSNLGVGAHHEGHWSESLDYLARCRETARKAGDLLTEVLAADNSAQVLSDRGMLEEAEATLRSSLRVWRAIENREFLAHCLKMLGRNSVRMGRFDEALALLDEARAEFEYVGYVEGMVESYAMIAECRAFMRDSDGALSLATETLARPETSEGGGAVALLHLVRGYAMAQMGATGEAEQAFGTSLEVARARGGGAHFDETLAIIALVRLSRATGREVDAALIAEGEQLVTSLGIILVPIVPLVALPT